MANPDWMLGVVIAVAVILCVLFIVLAVVIVYCLYCRRRQSKKAYDNEKIQQYINENESITSLSSLDEGKSKTSHITGSNKVSGVGPFLKAQSTRSMPERRMQLQRPWMRRNSNPVWRYKAKKMFNMKDRMRPHSNRAMSVPNAQSIDARSLKLRLTGQNYQSNTRSDFNFTQTFPPVASSNTNSMMYVHHSPVHHQNTFVDSMNIQNHDGVRVTTVETGGAHYEYNGQPYSSGFSGSDSQQTDHAISSSLKRTRDTLEGDNFAIVGPVLTSNKVVSTSERFEEMPSRTVGGFRSDAVSVLWSD